MHQFKRRRIEIVAVLVIFSTILENHGGTLSMLCRIFKKYRAVFFFKSYLEESIYIATIFLQIPKISAFLNY